MSVTKFWRLVTQAQQRPKSDYDRWLRNQALDELAAYLPDEAGVRVQASKPFRESRTVLWMKANMHLMSQHPAFDAAELAPQVYCDLSRIRKFLEDKYCRLILGPGIFFGIAEALGIGLYQMDELASPDLNVIGGLCRAAPVIRERIEPASRAAAGERPVLSLGAGLVGYELLCHTYRETLLHTNWRDQNEVSQMLSRDGKVRQSLIEIIKAANWKLNAVPLLAEAVGYIRLEHCLSSAKHEGYLAELQPYLPAMLLTRELFWRAAEDTNIKLLGLFDQISRTLDWDDPDDDAAGAAVAA